MERHSIFICHRQSDLVFAQALNNHLATKYGAREVFLANESMKPGEVFPDRLTKELAQARALLVVIGPDWLTAKDEHGREKLRQEDDWVRKEVATGLSNAPVTVIPVLIDDSKLPSKSELPEPLRGLADRHEIKLRTQYLAREVKWLIQDIDSSVFVAGREEVEEAVTHSNDSVIPAEQTTQMHGQALTDSTLMPIPGSPVPPPPPVRRFGRKSFAVFAFIAGIGVAALAPILRDWLIVLRQPECLLTFASIGLKDGAGDHAANREKGGDTCPSSGNGGTDPEMSSSNRDCEAYAALAAQFNSEHPNVKVIHKAYQHEWIKAHLAEFLQREDVPEVLVWSAGTHVEPYKDYLAGIDKKPEELTALKGTFMKHVQTALADLHEDAHFLPFKTYVWAFYYRPEIWEKRNEHKDQPWSEPKDIEQLLDLAGLMKVSNLEPIAFGNVHGWPALGYFDAINMRVAGFDWHQKLLERKVDWGQNPNNCDACKGLEETMKEWKRLSHFYSANWQRKSYRDAAHQLAHGDAGMFFIGGFFVEDLSVSLVSRLRAFAFPPKWNGDRFTGVDAPVDGFVFPRNAKARREHVQACVKPMQEFTEFLMSKRAYDIYDQKNPGSSLSVLEAYKTYQTPVQQDALSILKKHNQNNTVRRFIDREFRATEPGSGRDLVSDVLMPDFHALLAANIEPGAILMDLKNEVPKL